MSKRNVVVGIALLVVGFVGFWLAGDAEAGISPYRTGYVTLGDVESTVTSTGRVTAKQAVAVGTQVSGQVLELFADYNDRVGAGQLIARIDPTIQRQSLRNAEASLERSSAAEFQARREYERNLTLYEKQVITEVEFSQVEYSLRVARANLTSAEVAVEQAARNLSYTEIFSPIDGVVIERNVEPGQTVAASMSAPQLYLLASNLAEIEVLAGVDESDIGSVWSDMPVRFTVSAYPDDTFEGVVRQVRLASATQENVVSYAAVISVQNDDFLLLPGMTAEVDFIIEREENTLLVPNAALRFRPTDEMLGQVGVTASLDVGSGSRPSFNRPANGEEGDSEGEGDISLRGARPGSGAVPASSSTPVGDENDLPLLNETEVSPATQSTATVWYLKDGSIGVLQVSSGISDGNSTAVSAPGLEVGMDVIIGLTQPQTAAAPATTNPFQQQSGTAGGGGFGGPR